MRCKSTGKRGSETVCNAAGIHRISRSERDARSVVEDLTTDFPGRRRPSETQRILRLVFVDGAFADICLPDLS
jgi:hypothetical protein